uniref:Salivary secreted protein n=1 Tax=Panagrellus redivivus TaxID=6233 RepID=A0A7E4W6W5_PANRE
MRLIILCVAVTVAAAVPVGLYNLNVVLPKNPTSANFFTGAEAAWLESMVWSVRAVNVVRKLTAPTAFNDNLDRGVTFAQIHKIANLYSQFLTVYSQDGIEKLHKEVRQSKETVSGKPNRVVLDETLFPSAIQKFAEAWTILNDTYTLSQNLLQNKDSETTSRFAINDIDQNLRHAFSKLYAYDEYTKDAFHGWRNSLLAYRTSMSPAVMSFEQTLHDRKDERATIYQQIFNTNV